MCQLSPQPGGKSHICISGTSKIQGNENEVIMEIPGRCAVLKGCSPFMIIQLSTGCLLDADAD